MKEEKDYIRDIAEIRSMMERSSKFLSLSGWAGVMAGIYALAGAYIVWRVFDFNPGKVVYNISGEDSLKVILVACCVLLLAIGTAIFDSGRKAKSKGEKAWNTTSRRLLNSMAVPLVSGGILIIILIIHSLIGLVIPLTLVFYGLALYNAGNFTFKVLRIMGYVQISLGLISCYFIEFSLLIWTIGFGLVHIFYGIYMFRYER
ncbi:MAG TPA: hypothetical protein VK212_01690 [Lentimicrobium sp.]|nr:hypothetical protein [Lentimicrobium sp.]